MDHVAVVVRLNGVVVEERLVEVADGDVLGDADGARVRFPGAVLRVARDEAGALRVGGTRLGTTPVVLRLGVAEVELRRVLVRPRDPLDALPDVRLAVLTAAVILLAATLEAGTRLLEERPDLGARLASLILGGAPEP